VPRHDLGHAVPEQVRWHMARTLFFYSQYVFIPIPLQEFPLELASIPSFSRFFYAVLSNSSQR
jgi:hypothetical protein